MSFLYVIASDAAGPCKLGLSTNPQKRVAQLQTGNHSSLQLFHTEEIEDERVLIAEQALHRLLGFKRLKGEWFAMTVEDAVSEVQFIRMTEG